MKKGVFGEGEKKFDIILIDSLNLVHRFYWTMKNLSDSKGRPTGMLYGVINQLFHLKKKYGKAKIIFAWDTNPEYKKEISDGYKSNRKHEKPKGFWNQVKELQLLLSFYGIDQFYSPGYEADDIIAKIVKENSGKSILIISGDSDLKQLLSENTSLLIKNNIYTEKDFEDETGIPAEFYFMFKSIAGDKTDNIKGGFRINRDNLKEVCIICGGDINNIEKTDWGKEYKKTVEKIIENKSAILQNMELVKLQDNCKIEKIEKNKDMERFIAQLEDYEMKSLVGKLEGETK